MANIGGLHDREGRHIVPPGGYCVDTIALSESPQPIDYTALRGDINWIVRANWGYGSTGTIPLPHEYAKMATAAAAYVARSVGAHIYIIGNESNHEAERKDGVYITPAQYAECFRLCRYAIKGANPNAQVIPAPCAPYHADPMNWLDYWREMLTLIASNGGCDGIAVHAYTRSSNPADITSEAKMGAPLVGQYSGFRTYRDALFAVPAALEHLPAYITEFNELLPDGWHDANTGVVQEAFEEINDWNKNPHNQQIRALVLYRFPKYDKWHIDGKAGVIEDFRAACAKGYTASAPQEQTYMPSLGAGPAVPTAPMEQVPDPRHDWDERLTERGVKVMPAQGKKAWRITNGQWLDESQAGGRHHIYVDLLDEAGRRAVGVPLVVYWPGGSARIVTEAKLGEPYSANFPMTSSLSEFSIRVDDGTPSDAVSGIGMGADGNPSVHTSTAVTFQRVAAQATPPTAPTQPFEGPQRGDIAADPQTTPPAQGVPPLAHPVQSPALRRITQGWAARPAYYSRFKVDGVALKGHNGTDYATPVGSIIVAVDGGRVVEVADEGNSGFGKYIKLVHTWGESLYAHLFEQHVQVGETVIKGEVVAKSGNSGNSSGPHLHYGMRVSPFNRKDGWGGYTDPLPYLPAAQPVASTLQPIGSLLPLIKAAAQEFGIDWTLLASLAWAESSWNPNAISSAGAKGVMQIVDATWAEWSAKIGAGNNPFDAKQNLRVGAAYIAFLIQRLGSEWSALCAYNFGLGNVLKLVKPPVETTTFANKVIYGRDLLRATGS